MANVETPEQVRAWFLNAMATLWPLAEGSLSLRSCPCIRKNCSACERGEGHASYVLYAGNGKNRKSIYVPKEIAPQIAIAIENGHRFQELIHEAGVRYARAVKSGCARSTYGNAPL
jgi:hypothetical protein